MESSTFETIEVIETSTISPQFEMAQVASIMVQSLIAQSKTKDIYTTVTPNGILDDLKEASSNLESLEEHLNDTISEQELKKEWQKTSKLPKLKIEKVQTFQKLFGDAIWDDYLCRSGSYALFQTLLLIFVTFFCSV